MENISKDLELIDAVKSGNTGAFAEIIDRYQHVVASTVFGFLGECQEAEDIGQEVFIRFYKSISNFRGDAQLSTYLTRIAINLSLNEIKRRNRKKMFSLDYWINSKAGQSDSSVSQSNFEKKELIYFAIDKLEPKFRSVLVLRIIDGYSTDETAKILSLPKGTVLSRLARAQQKLKKILAPLLEE